MWYGQPRPQPSYRVLVKDEALDGVRTHLQILANSAKQTPGGSLGVEIPTIKLDVGKGKEK